MNNKLEEIIEATETLIEKKYIVIGPTVSFLEGAAFGWLGKRIKQEWIPAIPPSMDLFCGNFNVNTLFYGIGVATVYLPEIYQLFKNI